METPLSDEDVASLRALYEAGTCGLHQMAWQYRIGLDRIRRLAAKGNWTRPKVRIAPPSKPRVPLDLEALRRAYESADETLSLTALRFDISETTLQRYARIHQWMRDGRAYRKDGMMAVSLEQKKALAERLYDVLGAQIRALGGEGDDPEASPRRLEQLIKCMKTLQDLTAALGAAPQRPDDGDTDGRSTDDIRAAIRRRLDQRLAAAAADGVPGSADAAERDGAADT